MSGTHPTCRPLATALALACLASLLSAAGCKRDADGAPDVRVELMTVTPDPPSVGPAVLTLRLSDASTGQAITGAAVRIEATMSHAGMRPVFGSAREEAPGRYVTALELTMGGDWILLVDATLPDGRRLHRQLPLPGVRSRREP